MQPATHTLSTPPPTWFPERGTLTVVAVGMVAAEQSSETLRLERIARLLQKVLDAHPNGSTTYVYPLAGLIYVQDACGRLVADLFPAQAEVLIRRGLVRIQHSIS